MPQSSTVKCGPPVAKDVFLCLRSLFWSFLRSLLWEQLSDVWFYTHFTAVCKHGTYTNTARLLAVALLILSLSYCCNIFLPGEV